jgi:dihydroorotase
MQTKLITNARIVNEGTITEGDLLIKNGRIDKIAPTLSHPTAELIDAGGKLLLPGMIDCHVHFREPGLEAKGSIHSESCAAVAGGVTSFMEMPNTKPAAVTNEILEQKYAIAAQKSVANYSFYLGASNTNLDELKAINRDEICGVKLFMGASTGNLLVDREQTLENIFSQIDLPIAVHCEDTGMIRENEQRMRNRYEEHIPFHLHPVIRSEAACYASTKQAIELASKYNAQMHVLHLSTAKELELFEIRALPGKRITAEACPHYLWFSEEDYATKGALIKCNPAIKLKSDRDAIRRAVQSGLIDTIGTDHAPHLWEEKQNPYGAAPSGLPVIQSALPTALELFPPTTVVEKCAHAPAKIYKIEERGYLREGYWADLVLIDPNAPHCVSKENIAYKCGWSPFEGTTFQNSIHATFVNGEWAYREGVINLESRGKRLRFNR